jgi:hypothetical protein
MNQSAIKGKSMPPQSSVSSAFKSNPQRSTEKTNEKMKLMILCLCLGATLASAAYFPEKSLVTNVEQQTVFDKDMLNKQKFILDIFRHIHQPILNKEYLPTPNSIVMDKNKHNVRFIKKKIKKTKSLFRFFYIHRTTTLW